MKSPVVKTNIPHDTRESWLRAATDDLRPYFAALDYPLPDRIRFAIAFPSTGRHGKRQGECWHAETSEDGHFEVIVRADLADALEVLEVLVHELVHTVVPITAGHGKLYRDAAVKIGLDGQMRSARPGALLREKLVLMLDTLGPLPHARLRIERGRDNKGPADRPKKQGTRMLKATCSNESCDYVVRVAATPARLIGPPHCPKHAEMTVHWPQDEELPAAGGLQAQFAEGLSEAI